MRKRLFFVWLIVLTISANSQDSIVQMFGKVIDITNKPIEKVIVILKGTNFKTTTNVEGRYFFMLPARRGTIVYSLAGYGTKEIPFTGTPQANDILLHKSKENHF